MVPKSIPLYGINVPQLSFNYYIIIYHNHYILMVVSINLAANYTF